MKPGENLLQFADGISKNKLKTLQQEGDRPYLADFKFIEVRRGSELLFTKNELDQSTIRAFDLLKNKHIRCEGESGLGSGVDLSYRARESIARAAAPHPAHGCPQATFLEGAGGGVQNGFCRTEKKGSLTGRGKTEKKLRSDYDVHGTREAL